MKINVSCGENITGRIDVCDKLGLLKARNYFIPMVIDKCKEIGNVLEDLVKDIKLYEDVEDILEISKFGWNINFKVCKQFVYRNLESSIKCDVNVSNIIECDIKESFRSKEILEDRTREIMNVLDSEYVKIIDYKNNED